MSQETNLKSLDFVEAANTALASAQKLAEDVNQEKTAAAKLASSVVDSLVELRLIQDHEKTVALQKLGSHDGAVEVVGNLLTQINNMKVAEARQAALNQGSPDAGTAKTASDRAAEKPVVVGSKPGLGEKRGSDLAFLRGLGIPTE